MDDCQVTASDDHEVCEEMRFQQRDYTPNLYSYDMTN